MSRQLRLDVAQLTDVGRKRPHNEDNMAYVIPKDEQAMTRKGALFIVADGMGGHAAGEVASEIAVDTVTKAYYEDENEDISLSLINAIKRANTIIHQRADENTLRSGMGTTCVAAVLCGNVAYIANVGDSRAYLVHQTQVRQISQDHSWVEEQVRAGLLSRDQARSHAQRNVITRCLGTQTDVEVDVFPEVLSDGDMLVLCTDGLSGSIGEDDLHTILNQFVPQESVYHLVERANENGGPDNITAIVVRVLELGAEMPLARYPVPAGKHEADADTAILGRVPTSSLGSATRTEEQPRWTTPRRNITGPFAPAGDSSAETSTIAPLVHPTRRRLLYPSVALIALLLVTLLGGGTYYVVHSLNNSSSQLSNARSLIDHASSEAMQNPADALQQLSQAQNTLLTVQGPLLLGDQSTQYKTLQTNLNNALRKAVAAYNHQELVTQLPCAIAQSAPINANVQPVSLSVIQDDKGALYSYALANDHNLYQIDDQHRLVGPDLLANNVQVLRLSSSGQHLFALTSLPGQTGNSATYNINMLSFDQAPKMKEDQIPVDSNFIKDGWVPTFLTSYGNDVYMVMTSSSPLHQAMILYYDANNWHNAAQKVQISISPDIMSVAAFPGKQLFLLTNDGHVKILAYGNGGGTSQPDEVLLQNPVSPPLANDGAHFAVGTPIATPVPQPSQVGMHSFMDISGLTSLAAGSIGSTGTPHLYVVDNPNHRIMDFQFTPSVPVNVMQATPKAATSTPSSVSGAVNPASLLLVQQFASTGILSSVKSATVGSDGKHLYLLTQGGGTLTTISSLDKAPSCSPAA